MSARSSGGTAAAESRKGRRHRPQCPQCGSRRFRRDRDTSSVVCARGHVLQGFRQEETDADEEFGAGASQSRRRTRYVRKERNARRRQDERAALANKNIWHGERGNYLYFQCLQLVLRMQIKSLRLAIPSLPDELEGVCRDLWACFVSLEEGLSPQPHLESVLRANGSSEDSARSSHRRFDREKAARAELEAFLSEERTESQRVHDEMRSMGLTDDEATEEEQTDYETAAESENEKGEERYRRRRAVARGTKDRQKPKPGEDAMSALLSILYLSLVSLRVPIMWSDIRGLLIEEKIPFLHMIYRLPPHMTQHLNSTLAVRLDVRRVPSLKRLSEYTADFAVQLRQRFGLRFPEINCLPLLWRLTERLLLPPTFYCATKRVLSYLDLTMFPATIETASGLLVDGQTHSRMDGRRKRNFNSLAMTPSRSSIPRDILLLAGLVVVIKLRFGLDNEPRLEDPEDSQRWSGAPSLASWLDVLNKNGEQLAQSQARRLADANAVDLLDLTTSQVDRYLDHVEEHLVYDSHPNAFYSRASKVDIEDLLGEVLLKNSTIDTRSSDAMIREQSVWNDQLATTQSCLATLYDARGSLVPVQEEMKPSELRPGEAYSIYRRTGLSDRSPSDGRLVHPAYACVLRTASRLIDCETTELSDAVYVLEVVLAKQLLSRSAEREGKDLSVGRKRKRPAEHPRREHSTDAEEVAIDDSED